MADTEQGNIDIDDDFEWGFSFSDNDDGDLETVVRKTVTSSAVDIGPLEKKLDAILALIPTDGIENNVTTDVDLSSVENKLDQIIALEKVDALTAGDMPDISGLDDKLDKLLGRETTVNAPSVDIDLTEITDKLETLELSVGEVLDLDFNGDGNVDFGDINNNLADLLARQETVEAELEAKKQEFTDFKSNKLKALEKLIIPLLKNLKSNPDKAYIHWPNRAGILDAQIAKILGITR